MSKESLNEVIDDSYYEYDGSDVFPNHNATNSIRECIIALFEIIIGYIDEKREKEDVILFHAKKLLRIIDDNNFYYSYILPVLLELEGKSKKKIKQTVFKRRTNEDEKKLLISEKSVVKTLVEGIIGEYATQTEYSELDFGAMRVFCELGQQILNSGLLNEKEISSITAIVDNERLKSWSLGYSDVDNVEKKYYPPYQFIDWVNADNYYHVFAMSRISLLGLSKAPKVNLTPSMILRTFPKRELNNGNRYNKEEIGYPSFVFINWVDLNDMNHFNQIHSTSLLGLSKASKSTLTTAMAIERKFMDDDNDMFSYNSLAISYFGIVESELGLIIRRLDHTTKHKQLMWNDITQYCRNNFIPILSEKLPLYEVLKELRPIRNRVAHGGFIEKEEFKKIKQLTYSNQLIEFISWLKIDLGMGGQ